MNNARGVGLFKRLDEITSDDISYLIENKVEESQDLEFKREAYNPGKDKRERLKDISSMANGGGGYLIIGIEEETVTNRAQGIYDVPEPEKVGDALCSACLSGIEPRLGGLAYRADINVGGKKVLVVFVPPCGDKLHAVTIDDRVEFWKRYGNQSRCMRPEEIRQAFLQSKERYESSTRILNEAVNGFLSASYPKPRIFIAAIPLGAGYERLNPLEPNIEDVLKNPPYKKERAYARKEPLLYLDSKVIPTLRGAQIQESARWSNNNTSRIELHRNGYTCFDFEMCIYPENYGKNLLPDWFIAEFPLAALASIGEIFRRSGICDPVLADVALAGLSGYKMVQKLIIDRFIEPPAEVGNHFHIGIFEIPPAQDPRTAAGKIAHRIWNAFGLRDNDCKYFNEAGEFAPPKND